MAVKRKIEFDDYTQVNEVGSADVHGLVTQLSPIKKSKKGNNYYHGQVCDGQQSLRFVGFASNHQKILQDFLDKKESVEIHNCQIKKSNRDSDKLEILIKGATKILPSTKEFNVSAVEFQVTEAITITLNQVNKTEIFTIINVDVKVVNCGEPITLGTKQKQEVKVSDATGWAIVQLWEENIGLLVEGCSYKLKHFRIVEHDNVKFIAMCWEGSETEIIQNLQNTVSPPDNEPVVEQKSVTLHNPKIAAVYKLETFFKCLRCGSRTEPAQLREVRCCNRDCGILNDSTFCENFMSAEILIVDGQRRISLTAFGSMVAELLGLDENKVPTEEALLRAPPISQLVYQNNEIIKVVRDKHT